MKICAIFNPAARGEKAERFRSHLDTLREECVLKPTFTAGDGRRLAAEAVREGFEIIVAAGGDGTVNEVLNGMGDEPEGLARASLAVLPMGTANVFAHEIGMPTTFPEAWAVIRRAHQVTVDLGEAHFTSADGPQQRLFAQMAGAGVDSRAIELVDWGLKKRYGKLAYCLAGFKALRGSQARIIAQTAEGTWTGEQILIGNGRFYGGRFPLFPLANPRDGLLEVSIFKQASWHALLRGGWGLLTGQLYRTGAVQHVRTPSISLHSSSPVPFQVEGENVGHLPVRFALRRDELRIIKPAAP